MDGADETLQLQAQPLSPAAAQQLMDWLQQQDCSLPEGVIAWLFGEGTCMWARASVTRRALLYLSYWMLLFQLFRHDEMMIL